jgi:hypothetical protein
MIVHKLCLLHPQVFYLLYQIHVEDLIGTQKLCKGNSFFIIKKKSEYRFSHSKASVAEFRALVVRVSISSLTIAYNV